MRLFTIQLLRLGLIVAAFAPMALACGDDRDETPCSGYAGEPSDITAVGTRMDVLAVAVDPAGSVYIGGAIASTEGRGAPRIFRIGNDGRLAVVAGDDGAGESAEVAGFVTGLAFDRGCNLYFAEQYPGSRVRRVDPSGSVATVAGQVIDPNVEYVTSDAPVVATEAFLNPNDVAIGSDDEVYIVDRQGDPQARVVRLGKDGMLRTVAGSVVFGDNRFDPNDWSGGGVGKPATETQLFDLTSIAIAPDGDLFLSLYDRIRRVDDGGILRNVGGSGADPDKEGASSTAEQLAEGRSALEARIWQPNGIAFDAVGNLYVCVDQRVRKISRSGAITTFAGVGNVQRPATIGDGGPATAAWFRSPFDIAIGRDGTVYIVEIDGKRVRRIDSGGTITTIAGLVGSD